VTDFHGGIPAEPRRRKADGQLLNNSGRELDKIGAALRPDFSEPNGAENNGTMSNYSSKRSLSIHQKQMRSVTIALVLLLAGTFTALIFWLNR